MSIEKKSLDFITDKLINLEKYIEYCSEDLLSIASKYSSIPKGLSVYEIYKKPCCLEIDDIFWSITFSTKPKYQWLSVTMKFEQDNIVLIEVDDNDKAFEIIKQ